MCFVYGTRCTVLSHCPGIASQVANCAHHFFSSFFFFYCVEKQFFKRPRLTVLLLKVPVKRFTTASQFNIVHNRKDFEKRGKDYNKSRQSEREELQSCP